MIIIIFSYVAELEEVVPHPSVFFFYNKKQLKGIKDADMREYCQLGKENCRRRHLLRSLGDAERLQQDQ